MSSLDSSSDAVLLDDIADEFAQRQRDGENPTIDEYVARHPKLEEHIRPLLATLLKVEIARPDSTSSQPFVGVSGLDGAELKQLGDYRILREIGRGGMGVVFEAEQVSLGRRVALKALPQASQLDPSQFARFQLEARATARLEHPHIVPIHGVGEDDNLHYFTMQFIDGPGLGEVLNEVRLLRNEQAPHQETVTSGIARAMQSGTLSDSGDGTPPKEPESTVNLAASDTYVSLSEASRDSLGTRYFHNVARIGVQIASALEFAHNHGILHRDVKPSNILLDLRGKAWITDFGLAKADDAADVTHTGDIVGTLRYMAPERFEGWADLRSDVYSLGLTLYELATLQPAFGTGDRAALIQKIREADPPLPRSIDPRIPRDLETIILKAIAREPAQRYRTAGLLGEDLERFLNGQPIKARRTSTWEKTRLWVKRNPSIATLVASLILVLTAGFATSTWYWHKAAERAEALARSEQTARRFSQLAAKRAAEADERAEALAKSEKNAKRLSDIATQRASEAEESRVQAEAKHDLALSKSRDMRAAVDQLFTAIADDPLLKTVGLEKFRRSMLERANSYYEEFHAETPDDPGLAYEHAQLTYKLADMNRQLGDLVTAKRMFASLIDNADNAERVNPALFHTVYRSRQMVAECSWKLGEEGDQLSQLVAASDRLVEKHLPATAAKFLTECAHMATTCGRTSDAWELSSKADALWQTIKPPPGMRRQHDLRLALHCTTRSRLALEVGDFEAVRTAATRAVELLKPYGPNAMVSATIADMDYLMAVSYSKEGRLTESTAKYRDAIRIFSAMQAEHPDVVAYHIKLLEYRYHLALNLHREKRYDEALKELTRTLEKLDAANQQFPDVTVQRMRMRGDALNLLSGICAEQEDYAEQGRYTNMAVVQLQEVPDLDSSVAALTSLGSALIHKADYLANIESELSEQVAVYDQAIETLQHAVELDAKNGEARTFLAKAYYQQALILFEANEHDAAMKRLDQAVELDDGEYSAKAKQKLLEEGAAVQRFGGFRCATGARRIDSERSIYGM